MRRFLAFLLLTSVGTTHLWGAEKQCVNSLSQVATGQSFDKISALTPGETYTFKSKRGNFYTGVYLGVGRDSLTIRFRPSGEANERTLVLERLEPEGARPGKSVSELHDFTPEDLVSVTSVRGNEHRGSIKRFSDDGSLVFFLPEGKEDKPENVISLRTNQLNLPRTKKVGTLSIRGPPVRKWVDRGLEPQEVLFDGKKIQHFGESAKEHLELMKKNGLGFTLETKAKNATYRITEPFDIGDGRIAVLALVEPGDGKSYLRAYYRSNSQGEFRVLPARNKDVPFHPEYDKGKSENTLVLPTEVQSLMANRIKGGTGVKKLDRFVDADAIFHGAVRHNVGFENYMKYYDHSSYIGKGVKENRIVTGTKEPKEFLRPPNKDQIEDPGNKPNFSKVINSYKTESALAGEVEALVYQSRNGKIEYTVFKDKEGKIWFQSPIDLTSPINNWGVGQTAISIGNLGMPRWEYASQVHPEYHGKRHSNNSSYVDAWKYLREMPTIREWYTSQGLPVPE